MLKSQDIVVLLKIAGEKPGWTLAQVARELELSSSAVHRSLERAGHAGLYSRSRRAVNPGPLLEFLVHGAKYAFPAVWEGEARGILTAWAAPPLADLLTASGGNPPVWPYAKGKKRGIALQPLHRSAPKAALRDSHLRELLALFDAIRIGNARERALAEAELGRRLQGQRA